MKLHELTKNQTAVIFMVVYAFTIAIGFLVYILGLAISWGPILAMFIADIIMTMLIYFIGLFMKNASLYDPYWSVIPPFLYFFWMLTTSSLVTTLNIVVLLVILFWAVRLTYNWWRNWTGFAEQDWRYDMLRDKNKKLYPITNLMGIHMFPTIIVFVQMINVYQATSLTLNFLFLLGLLICLTAPVIQFISDKQMYEFRQENKVNKGIIDRGLWKYSRHPNYFGEVSFWVGLYVIYFSSSKVLDINILFPISMIILFVFISIPMMEKKLMQREEFTEYKKQVSMIVPFFRKQG